MGVKTVEMAGVGQITETNITVQDKRYGKVDIYTNEEPPIRPILIGGGSDSKFFTRVLYPQEYLRLWRATPDKYKIVLDFLLTSGVRYVEGQFIQKHPEVYDINRQYIQLPSGVEKKQKQVFRSRFITLSDYGNKITPQFFNAIRMPARCNWDIDLKRWAARAGLDITGISSKTTRKTCESWLMMFYKDRQAHILLRQGHIKETEIKHYLAIPFNEHDISLMKLYVDGMNFK